MSLNSEFLDKIIASEVALERVKVGAQKEALKLLQELEKKIYSEIMTSGYYDVTAPSYRARRLNALLKTIDTSIKDYSTSAKRLNRSQLKQIAVAQAAIPSQILNSSLAVDIFSPVLTSAMLDVIVSDTLIQGARSAEWWSRQTAGMRTKFADAIRKGYAMGETNGKIVSNIKGTMANGFRGTAKQIRQQISALTRTSIQTVSNEVRLETYKKMELVERIQWMATFDDRTTEICIGLDGLEWKADTLEPVGHNTMFPGPTAHWMCRSTQLPITMSFEKLATREKKLAAKIDKQISPATRASMDGQVPASMNYETWLRSKELQQPGFANTVLGVKKAELWRQGQLTFKELIDESARPQAITALSGQNVVVPYELWPARIQKRIDDLAAKEGISREAANKKIQEGWGPSGTARKLGQKKWDEFVKSTQTPPTPAPPPIVEGAPDPRVVKIAEQTPQQTDIIKRMSEAQLDALFAEKEAWKKLSVDEIDDLFRVEARYLRETKLQYVPDLYGPEAYWGPMGSEHDFYKAMKFMFIKRSREKRILDWARGPRPKIPVQSHPTPFGFNVETKVDFDKVLDKIAEMPGAKRQVELLREHFSKYRTGTVLYDEHLSSQAAKALDYQTRLKSYQVRLGHTATKNDLTPLDDALGWTRVDYNFAVVKVPKHGMNFMDFDPYEYFKTVQAYVKKVGQELKDWGNSYTQEFHMSGILQQGGKAGSAADYVATWIHEMGHNILYKARESGTFMKFGGVDGSSSVSAYYDGFKPFTRYAQTNDHEWFAEHFTLWLTNYEDLKAVAPDIAKLIDAIVEEQLSPR